VSPGSDMRLTIPGQITQDVREALPTPYSNVAIETFVVMPDYSHGILWLSANDLGAALAPPTPTLGNVVRTFTSVSTREINGSLGRSGGRVWQRSYYDRVICTEENLTRPESTL